MNVATKPPSLPCAPQLYLPWRVMFQHCWVQTKLPKDAACCRDAVLDALWWEI